MHFTVFYAWQSDRPDNTNRRFIEKALADAISEIHADATLGVSLTIDSDTKNVPGTADIANTILTKIDSCGVFLADVTLTGKTDPSVDRVQKPVPNSNVLLELGYAVKAVTWEQIILVMNEEFGRPEEQIFDLRHRNIQIRYRVSEDDANKVEVQAKLTSEIKAGLLEIIKSGLLNQQSKTGTVQLRIAEERRRFEDSLKKNSFHRLAGQKGIIAVSLVPEQPLTNHINVRGDGLAELGFFLIGQEPYPSQRLL